MLSSLEVVREDFSQKVALELGSDERWKFWGLACQAAKQAWFNLCTYTTCWLLIFSSQRPAVFIFITHWYLALSKTRVVCSGHRLGECRQLSTHVGGAPSLKPEQTWQGQGQAQRLPFGERVARYKRSSNSGEGVS